MSSVIKPGEKEAKRARRLQQQQLAEQRQREQRESAVAEDEVARRQALAAQGGFRRSLLTGAETGAAPTGTAQRLGG